MVVPIQCTFSVFTLTLAFMLPRFEANVIAYDVDHLIIDEFFDLPASFGALLPLEGVHTLMVYGIPSDGCTPISLPPKNVSNPTGRWSVLVARGECSFEMKARNAMEAGYDVLIVHNVNSSDLEVMSAANPAGITVAAVFINDEDGQSLREKFTYDKGYFVKVNSDVPIDINTHLLLPFVAVVALCLLVMVIFMIVKWIKDRRRARRRLLPNKFLKQIPTCKFSKGDPYDTCAICLDDYQEGERLRVLPCAHAYHSKCIDPWLTKNQRVCPVCKRKVRAAGEPHRAHSDSDTSDDEAPLLPARDDRTQGGTFDEQTENPFVRARRFMRRLRRAQAPVAPQTDSDTDGNDNNEQQIAPPEQAPHLRASVSSEDETHPRHQIAGVRSTPALVRSSEHSINVGDEAPIRVAAIPAPASDSHHVDL